MTQKRNFAFYGRQVVIESNGSLGTAATDLTKTTLFREGVHRFLDELRERDSSMLEVFPPGLSAEQQDEALVSLLQKLSRLHKEELIKLHPEFKDFFRDHHLLAEFIRRLYDYWCGFERFFVCHSDAAQETQPYRTFGSTVEELNHIVRRVYRDISENITEHHPRVYRQTAAGCQVGLIVTNEDWPCPPAPYDTLKGIPFIRQMLLKHPLIIDPPMNTRTGQFRKVDSNPLDGVQLDSGDWLCYPAKVGELVIHLFFHKRFISLGASLANLFWLADDHELKRKPDAICAYGVDEELLKKFGDLPTVFFDDEKNNLLVGAIPGSDRFGYFGYIKKMMLTLHNVIMMKKGRLPVHGAMVRLLLRNGRSANVVILGDTGTGKSESLEAFRVLGKTHIRDMIIIFDDMGSLELFKDGTVKAYGTEIGAFVRLDDLKPGFAFGSMEKSIIMSPQKTNARVVIPVTTLKEVLHGYRPDFLLYANNYEDVDEAHPILEEFKSAEDALRVFREGAAMSKGTTTEKGITHAYFANIFGPLQCKELHDELAKKFFNELFRSGVKVAQLRTRLGIPGYETKGPEESAKALFEVISKPDKTA